MNRSRLLFLVFSSLLVLPMLMALVVAADPGTGRRADWRKGARGPHGERAESTEEDTFDTYLKYLKVFSEVLGLIRDTYVDEPNTDALMAGALEGGTDAMDPVSGHVPHAAVTDAITPFLHDAPRVSLRGHRSHGSVLGLRAGSVGAELSHGTCDP